MFGFGLIKRKKGVIRRYQEKDKASSPAAVRRAGRCERSCTARKRIQRDQREKMTAGRAPGAGTAGSQGSAWDPETCGATRNTPEKRLGNTQGSPLAPANAMIGSERREREGK